MSNLDLDLNFIVGGDKSNSNNVIVGGVGGYRSGGYIGKGNNSSSRVIKEGRQRLLRQHYDVVRNDNRRQHKKKKNDEEDNAKVTTTSTRQMPTNEQQHHHDDDDSTPDDDDDDHHNISLSRALSTTTTTTTTRALKSYSSIPHKIVIHCGAGNHKESKSSGIFCATQFNQIHTLDKSILSQLQHLKYDVCTNVQSQTIPIALEGKDCLIRSSTGSGKTLAFGVPIVDRLKKLIPEPVRKDGVLCVILSPTKELALQTVNVMEKLTQMMPNIVCGSLTGGENPKSEKSRIRKGINILCATPGRLNYHLSNTSSLKVDKCMVLVMDEADRLLDMGFEVQVKDIYNRLHNNVTNNNNNNNTNNNIQCMLVSATLNNKVEELAKWALDDEARWIDCDNTPPKKLKQSAIIYDEEKDKLPLLIGLLLKVCNSRDQQQHHHQRDDGYGYDESHRIMVFTSNCATVDYLHNLLTTLPWPMGSNNNKGRIRGGGGGIGNDREDGICNNNYYPKSRRQLKREMNNNRVAVVGSGGSGSGISDDAMKMMARGGSRMGIYKLHGDLPAEDRNGAMADFTATSSSSSSHHHHHDDDEGDVKSYMTTKLLICTDVAARGLDIKDVDMVIQYDAPTTSIEEYIHRIGRTARIGKSGSSILMLRQHEKDYIHRVESSMIDNNDDTTTTTTTNAANNAIQKDKKQSSSSVITVIDNTTSIVQEISKAAPMKSPLSIKAEEKEEEEKDESTKKNKNKSITPYQRKQARKAVVRDIKGYISSMIGRHIEQDELLYNSARKAYFSSLRAYRTYPHQLRDIFDFQQIDFRLFASGFGLKHVPKTSYDVSQYESGHGQQLKRKYVGPTKNNNNNNEDSSSYYNNKEVKKVRIKNAQQLALDEFAA
ncbi:DEAD box ATP-dependent RNA helicase, putative [Perkinsus marinus ATCC 50983]|uniref:DEAD box ATP-dependent RNA helicase, putative n=1 Tax=Perkinsus marinus (strain ATCC 50983 / TXsc) TaxID=423536 RepID=C5KVS5_PERM5|nr:DEAD box ATP-dependent RNA helicase, putative [Perkinsus marinus ATCC 50983]EER11460.1 DEAD box ATP-dependent RNA helicase, putative [Perkinsus marinus ATCC 50983]|eukprot:XP_002779665.1 DEAD box ATP-dependent RNA helicase, putative [Perkinsus marinus ATCC 50983]